MISKFQSGVLYPTKLSTKRESSMEVLVLEGFYFNLLVGVYFLSTLCSTNMRE